MGVALPFVCNFLYTLVKYMPIKIKQMNLLLTTRRAAQSPAGDIGVDRKPSHAKACGDQSHGHESPAGLCAARLFAKMGIYFACLKPKAYISSHFFILPILKLFKYS
jgi:hypothetical protein